jgi:DNA-binding transcriptional ArsR family regulator
MYPMSDELDRCDLLCIDLPRAEAVRGRIGCLDAAALSTPARVLGDVTRFRLAAALAMAEELCVCDLAWVVARSDKLVSHHLQALRQGGIAESRRDGKIVFYRLTDTGRRIFEAFVPDVAGVSA